MKKLPDMMFVVDAVKEHIAVKEAKRMGMKVIAPLDTNCDPDVVDYPIPGNDDAMRAISLYCDLVGGSILDGLQVSVAKAGVDLGEAAEPMVEAVVAEAAAPVEATTPVEAATPAEEVKADA
jgi:small subunit ribosomal protein S2